MNQLPRYEVEQKIHNFITKKSTSKHAGDLVTDWFFGKATARLHKTRDYEPLPWIKQPTLRLR